MRFRVAAILLTIASGLCLGQPTESVTLSGEVDLARLVDLSAQQLDLDIQYDPAQLRQRVTLRIGEDVSAERLWSLTNDLLAANGLTTVRRSGSDVYTVVTLQNAPGAAALETDIKAASRSGFGSVVIEVENRSSEEAIEVIRPLLTRPGGTVTTLGSSGLILISDQGSRLGEIAGIIEAFDASSAALGATRFQPASVSAQRLLSLNQEIRAAGQQVNGLRLPRGQLLASPDGRALLIVATPEESSRWSEFLTRLDQPEGVERRVYTVDGFGLDEVRRLIEATLSSDSGPLRIVSDDLTGSLVITATPSEHAEIEAIFARLDAIPPSARQASRTFVIENRNASDLLGVVDGLIDAGALQASGTPDSVADSGVSVRAREDAPAPEQDRVALAVDDATNAIIAIGEPRMIAQLETIITKLDVRQSQVQLEVLLVSLTEGDTLDLGVEIEGLVRSGSIRARLSSLFGLSVSGDDGRTVGDASGFTGVVLDPGEFSVVVRALETLNDGRSLSMPRIVVSNNRSATLDSVVQEPFLSTNASDTVATTSFGGTQDAGTTVTLRPQIAEGDHLLLEYSVSLSSFVGESSDPGIPPPRQQNSVQSVVSIPDGFTIAVGGIELMTEADAESRVPIIGQIPLIGELAKSRSRSASRSRFYVFIRATVLRDRGFEDLKYLSEVQTDRAGVDDGWPTVEPRLIR